MGRPRLRLRQRAGPGMLHLTRQLAVWQQARPASGIA